MEKKYDAGTDLIIAFFASIRQEPRITSSHISLYMALWQQRAVAEGGNSLLVFSRDIMPFCKLSGAATYYRCLKELCQYGYIRYTPSYNHFIGSLVQFVPLADERYGQ